MKLRTCLVVLIVVALSSPFAADAAHRRNRFDRQSDRPQQIEQYNKRYWDAQRNKGERDRSRRDATVNRQKEERRQTQQNYQRMSERQRDRYDNMNRDKRQQFDRNSDFWKNLND